MKVILCLFLQFVVLFICASDVSYNPFNNAFKNLDKAVWSSQQKAEYIRLFISELKKEHPDVDARQLKFLVEAAVDGDKKALNELKFRLDQHEVKIHLNDEFINQLCSACESFNSRFKSGNFRNIIILALRKVPSISFSRYLGEEILYISSRQNRAAVPGVFPGPCDALLKLLAAGKVPRPLIPYVFQRLCHYQYDLSVLENMVQDYDPWFSAMVKGQAASNRAWKMVADDLTPLNDWQQQHMIIEMKQAKNYFLQALALWPEMKLPYLYLIRPETVLGDLNSKIDVFLKWIEHQPDSGEGFDEIAIALSRKWQPSGGVEQLANLSVAALSCSYQKSEIPLFGFNLLGGVVWDEPERVWKNIYSRPEVISMGDRLIERFSSDYRYLPAKVSFEMASRRYGRAHATSVKFPIYWDFASAVNYNSIQNFARKCTSPSPSVLSYTDAVTELRLYTGKYRSELVKAEDDYLAGNIEDARSKLREVIKIQELKPDERNFIIDKMARYALDAGGCYYRQRPRAFRQTSAFQVALMTGQIGVAAEMLELGFRFRDYEDKSGETAMLVACYGRNPEAMDILLKNNMPLVTMSYQDMPLLHYAARHGNIVMIKKLLSMGCEPLRLDCLKRTPLYYAVESNNPAAANILLDAAGDPPVGFHNATMLMCAIAKKQNMEMLKLLIERSTNISHIDEHRRSILHYVAEFNPNPLLYCWLVKAGANPGLKDFSGRTALDIAKSKNKNFDNNLLALQTSTTVQ